MREHLRAARLVLRYVFRADPARATASMVIAVVASVLDVCGAVVLKLLTDAAVQRDQHRLAVALVVMAACLAGTIAGHWASLTIGMALRERATLYFDTRMAQLAGGIHHLEHHERPEYLDELEILNRNHQKLAGVQDALIFHVATVARLVLTVVLLARVHPLLLLAPLSGVPSVLAAVRVERVRRDVHARTAWRRRLEVKLFTLASARDAGKELRLYGASDELLARFDAVAGAADREEGRLDVQEAVLKGLGWVAFALGFSAGLLLVTREAIAGRATPGDVVLAFTLVRQINFGVVGLRNSIAWLIENLTHGRKLVWLEDFAAEAAARAAPPAPGPAPAPAALAGGIGIEGVRFRYPGTEEAGTPDVLGGIDLLFPAGSTVAIVGDNGAGKTTLVKLLCRFYDPSAGRITVDGVDLRSLELSDWRRRLSGCFQDFARLELVAREAVGVGDLPRCDLDGAVEAALDRAHAADVPSTLPAGLTTQLGKSFRDGTEPSTGQWQKLALGRAMMREEPLLLLLDEPTASLDPVTEHALFERYAGAAAQAADRAGAITILVSHRFSTVRMADLIVVLKDGRVAEIGSHDDLVAAGGTYSALYRLQARAYR